MNEELKKRIAAYERGDDVDVPELCGALIAALKEADAVAEAWGNFAALDAKAAYLSLGRLADHHWFVVFALPGSDDELMGEGDTIPDAVAQAVAALRKRIEGGS